MEENTSTNNPTTQASGGGAKWAVLVVALLVIGGGIFFAVKKSNTVMRLDASKTPSMQKSDDISKTPSVTTVQASGAAMQETGTVKSFTVSAKNFSFTPAEIRVKKGDTVKITFTNTEGFHDWNLDEYNVHMKKIPTGQSETAEFVADKIGTFEYYCSVGNHRQMGMRGNLIVE